MQGAEMLDRSPRRAAPRSPRALAVLLALALTGLGLVPGTAAAGHDASSLPPALTSIEPRVGVAGQLATIRGTGFADAESANVVTFGRVAARVVDATPSRLIVVVPAMGQSDSPPMNASGKVRVRTAAGVNARTLDFFVPPIPGQTPADVTSTGRIHMNSQPRTVELLAGQKVALLLLDAQKGQHLSVDFFGSTVTGGVFVVPPGGTDRTYGSAIVPDSAPERDANHFHATVPVTGSYTLVLRSDGAAGRVTVQASFPPFGERAWGGEATDIRIVTPRWNVVRYFGGTAGTRLGIVVRDSTFDDVFVAITDEDGRRVFDGMFSRGTTRFSFSAPLPTTGTYRAVVDPHRHATGTLSMSLYQVTDP
jgi:hypothetical protein